MYRQTSARSLVLAFAFVFVPVLAGAHGSEASFERTVDGVLVDVGYSTEEITAGTPVSFDFALLDTATGEEVDYSDIWVRLHRERNVFFAGGVHKQRVGATTMLFQFPNADTYTLSVRFQNEGEPVAEASFEVPVASSEENAVDSAPGDWLSYLGLLALGAALGVALTSVVRAVARRRRA